MSGFFFAASFFELMVSGLETGGIRGNFAGGVHARAVKWPNIACSAPRVAEIVADGGRTYNVRPLAMTQTGETPSKPTPLPSARMDRSRFLRSDRALLFAALVCGVFFFASLDRLWPLAAIDLHAPPEELIATGREWLAARNVPAGSSAASRLTVDEELLDYLHRAFGRDQTQRLIREGFPIYLYDVRFKERDDPDFAWVAIHPDKGVLSWGRTVQEDAPGAFIEMDDARAIASRAVPQGEGFVETGRIERTRPNRRDHFFVYERYLSRSPELRERLSVTVTGTALTAAGRELILPESARRDLRTREAPSVALQTTGFLLAGVAALGALVVFLTRLQRGQIELRRAAWWVAIIATFFMITQILRSANLLLGWDPLWPRWIATLQSLGFSLAQGAWIALALFIVIAAGDALDRELRAGRGESLWAIGQGRLFRRAVGMASLRGFLIGLICGATLVSVITLLEVMSGAQVALQPQGFFFFALNSDAPAVSTLLYFLMVALVEELGYRFFGGSWLLSMTGKRWLAIGLPALLYGVTHTGLPFIPPYEPFWGRAVAFAVVGAIWGWAFFRYDALTVVLSHFAADLFIFNWPRLASGDPLLVAKAVATIAVPLIPAAFLLWPRSSGSLQGGISEA